jgi:hypothetical protein
MRSYFSLSNITAGFVAMMVGFNIHEEPGVLKVNQASAKVSAGIWTDLPKT